MIAAIDGDSAQRRARVHQKHRRFTVDLRSHEQVVLRRKLQREGLVLRGSGRSPLLRQDQGWKAGEQRDEQRGGILAREKIKHAGEHGPEDST